MARNSRHERKRMAAFAIPLLAAAMTFAACGSDDNSGDADAGQPAATAADESAATDAPAAADDGSPKQDGTLVSPVSGLINEVQDLALAPDGTVWVATRGGVVQWEPGGSTPIVYGEEHGLPAADIDQIVVATDGTVWVAGSDWVAYYDQTWQSIEMDLRDKIATDPAGGLLMLGWDGEGEDAVFRVDRNGTEQISPLPEDNVGWYSSVAITTDSAGRFWMVDRADDHLVFVYDGSTWEEFTTPDRLFDGTSHYLVSSIEIARNGAVWISTQRDSDPEPEGTPAPGVAVSDGQGWRTFTTADGLASDAGTVVVASDGTVWVVHGDAVSRLDGDTWIAFDIVGSPRSGTAGVSDGSLWLGTDTGIVHFDGDTTTPYVVPVEMTPTSGAFSLEPMASVAPPVNGGPFGNVTWQKYSLPVGHSLTGGIATPYGFAATGNTSIRTSTDGLNWDTSEPPLEARHLVASGPDLYALGAGATRLTWTGAAWKVVDDLNIPDPGPEILSEGGYVDFAERMAFGDGVTVMTARSRVFFSTDGSTFVPAVRGPDPELLEGAGETESPDSGYAGRCNPSWVGGWTGEGSIGPIFATERGFVAFTAGHPHDWNATSMCEPVVWTSNDGSTWDLASAEAPFGPTAYIHDMAEHNGRIVAVGGRSPADEGVVWVSDDGVTWNEIPPERISGSLTSGPWAIAVGDAGWVALYGNAGTLGGVRAMYSLDGLNWAVAAEAIPDFWWAWGTPDVAVGTDRILITYYNDVAVIGVITR